MIPLIYIAGPFRAPTAWGIAENVREAERWGLLVAQAGAYPVIPHANTHLFQGQCNDAFWLEGTIALMRKCDGVLLCPRWRESKGATAEAREANRLGIPIFSDVYLVGDPIVLSGALANFVARLTKKPSATAQEHDG